MFYLFVVVSVVILISAVCSLFEAVLYTVSLGHIESLAQSGHRAGRILRELRREMDRPIAAILILNTVAHTAGAAFAGAIAVKVFGSAWLGWFSAIFTLAILMFSEIIPKTAGVAYSKRLSTYIALPLQGMVWFFTPVIRLSGILTRLVSRRGKTERVTDEELLVMVKLGMRTGDFKEHEAKVIQNVLALEAKSAKTVMTPRSVLFALAADATVGEVRDEESLLNYSRIPVYGDNLEDIVGIVHRRDILTAIGDDRFSTKLRDLMRPVHFVLETVRLDALLRTFLERRQHLVVVIGEHGALSGVVSLEDVLEEILGREIVDEFDQVADLQAFARRQRAAIVGGQDRTKPRPA